jgi:hypothetical protein
MTTIVFFSSLPTDELAPRFHADLARRLEPRGTA